MVESMKETEDEVALPRDQTRLFQVISANRNFGCCEAIYSLQFTVAISPTASIRQYLYCPQQIGWQISSARLALTLDF